MTRLGVLAFAVFVEALAAQVTYTVTDLGVLPGDVSSEAVAINNSGQVIGISVSADGSKHAFLWEAGAMQGLGVVADSQFPEFVPRAINDLGEVVGGDVLWHAAGTSHLNRHLPAWRGGVGLVRFAA
jgi:probable HAF family extracellular repeat protein